MRFPEFTAAAALDTTSQTTFWSGRAIAPDAQGVQPALPLPPRGCMSRCLAEQGDDPFATENCHCVCYGHPGRTCWLI